jgi:O-antigen/teichoic acid export membrane protein
MKWSPSQLVRIIAFLDQGVVSGGNFVAGVLMARAFGAYEFGWFTLAWLVVEFMASLQFAGVLQPMLNIGAKENEADRPRYYCAVAVQQAAVCAFSALFVWVGTSIVGPLLGAGFEHLAIPLSLATIAFQAQNFFRRYFFSRGRATVALANDCLRVGLQIVALLALTYFWAIHKGETGIWIVAAACGISSIQGMFFFGRFEWDGIAFRQVLLRHWTFSRWLLPSAVMFWMTSQAFVLMSGVVLGVVVTGSLKAAVSLVGVINIMLQALDSFAPTQAAGALHRGGGQELVRYMARLSAITAALLAAMVAILLSDADALAHLVFGNGYEGLGYMMRWMCASSVAYGLAVLLGIWAAAIECTKMIFFSYAIATAFTVAAAYPMTRYLGIEGVLLGALIVEVIKVTALFVPLIRWVRTLHISALSPS